jgi:hypothetical protein
MEVITMNNATPASAAILANQHAANSTRSQLLALRIRGNGTG